MEILFEVSNIKVKSILRIDSLRIYKNKVTCIIGPSGSGKTTFLRLLNKLHSPDEGKIIYQGQSLEEIDSVKHRQHVVMLSQKPVMFSKSVYDNLVIGCHFSNKPIPPKQELQTLLKQLQVNKEMDDDASLCSIGEKQRIALARVLLLDPDVYLMDEPSSALDQTTERMIVDFIVRKTKENNKSLIMITHSDDIARKFADKLITIEKGMIYE